MAIGFGFQSSKKTMQRKFISRLFAFRVSGKSVSDETVYKTIEPEFDRKFYLGQYPDIVAARVDPVKHYIEHGGQERRDPSPLFNTKYYVDRYPDVASSDLNPFYHYLTIGKAEGRGATPFSAGEPDFDAMCEILGGPSDEIANELIARRRDLRKRLESDVLGEMVRKAGELEPLIHQSWSAAMTAAFPPFHSASLLALSSAMYRLQEAAGGRRARVVVAMRSGGLSGAARLAGRLATALAEIYGADDIVVLRTDQSDAPFAEWFPAGCRHIDLPGSAENVGPGERQILLVEFLRSLRLDVVFNVNSRLFWDALPFYGEALAADASLYAYLFCNDMDAYGHWVGYPNQFFYRYFDLYEAVMVDSHALEDELRVRFQIPPAKAEKLVALNTPIRDPFPLVPAPKPSAGKRRQVFWSGRFDRQKRPDIVAALAARLPELDFHLWGKPQLDNEFAALPLPKNILLEGVYESFADLPLDRCDLWLYTSQWDGVPNVLLEVASAGIPIVGSLAGGCGEILIEGLCERVADVEDVDAFEAAIRRMLADPAAARERAKHLRQRMLAERSPSAYRAEIASLLSRSPAA